MPNQTSRVQPSQSREHPLPGFPAKVGLWADGRRRTAREFVAAAREIEPCYTVNRVARDVDLIVDLARPMGLRFFTLQDEVASRLGARVDLVTEAGLAPDIRHTALQDAVDA